MRISSASVVPAWHLIYPAVGDTPAVRVRMAPIGPKAVRAARRALAAALGVDPEDLEQAGDQLSMELMKRGLLEWEGVGGVDDEPVLPTAIVPLHDAAGAPLLDADGAPITRRASELFLADPEIFERLDRAYVLPWAQASAEKNGYAGSLSGTSAGETPASDTATSPATSDTTAAASGAPSAPISSTSRKPRKRKPSGK